MMGIKPITCTTSRGKVHCELRVIMTRQCGFIYWEECATLLGNVAKGEGSVYMCGGWDIHEISVPFSEFYCEDKISLKNLVYLKKKKN